MTLWVAWHYSRWPFCVGHGLPVLKAHSTRYVTAVPLTAVRNSFLNAWADLGRRIEVRKTTWKKTYRTTTCMCILDSNGFYDCIVSDLYISISRYLYLSVIYMYGIVWLHYIHPSRCGQFVCWHIKWGAPTLRAPSESAFFARVPSTWKDGNTITKMGMTCCQSKQGTPWLIPQNSGIQTLKRFSSWGEFCLVLMMSFWKTRLFSQFWIKLVDHGIYLRIKSKGLCHVGKTRP